MDPSSSYTATSYFADFGLVLFALFLVLLNGFFVAAEFAIVRLRATKVDALANRFPEAGQRKRKWFSPRKAARKVAEPELQALLAHLPRHLAEPPTAA